MSAAVTSASPALRGSATSTTPTLKPCLGCQPPAHATTRFAVVLAKAAPSMPATPSAAATASASLVHRGIARPAISTHAITIGTVIAIGSRCAAVASKRTGATANTSALEGDELVGVDRPVALGDLHRDREQQRGDRRADDDV